MATWSEIKVPYNEQLYNDESVYNVEAYRVEGLEWSWKYTEPITAIADDGGNLQITVADVSDISVGDYVYIDILEASTNYDVTPFVEVLEIDTLDITLDVDYDASYSSTGELRIIKQQEMTVLTGYNVPEIPELYATKKVRGDRKGYYTVDVKSDVITRFVFGSPLESITNPDGADISDKADTMRVQFYPDGETATNVRAIKLSGDMTDSTKRIFYNGIENIWTYFDDLYIGYNNQIFPTSYDIDDGGVDDIALPSGLNISVTFEYAVEFGSQTVSGLPANMVLVTNVDGDYTGVEGYIEDSGTFTISGNGAGGLAPPTVSYEINFTTLDIEVRNEYCENKSFVISWWDYENGGWKQYAFNQAREYSVKAKVTPTSNSEGEYYVETYDRAEQAVNLIADFEDEETIDYLNRMTLSTQIYKANFNIDGEIESYERMYVSKPQGRQKSILPFLSVENQFTVDLTYSREILTCNEG